MAGAFTDKVVVVTGGGSGIGRAIALAFGAEGARVVICGRTEATGARVAGEIVDAGGRAAFVRADVSRKAEVDRLVAEVANSHGGLDIMVQNAGVGLAMPLESLSEEQYLAVLHTNLSAAIWLTAASAPHLARSPDGGRMLITSSSLGIETAMPQLSHYAASRGGLRAFIKSAAVELGPRNVTVNCVECGMIAKDDQEGWTFASPEAVEAMTALVPVRRLGKPQDIVNAMLFLASPQQGFITGQALVVDGGATLPHIFTTIARGRA